MYLHDGQFTLQPGKGSRLALLGIGRELVYLHEGQFTLQPGKGSRLARLGMSASWCIYMGAINSVRRSKDGRIVQLTDDVTRLLVKH